MIVNPEDQRFSRQQAAEYLQNIYGLRCSVKTLANHASLGKGPRFYWIGRYPIYSKAEIDRWVVLYRGPSRVGPKARRAKGANGKSV